MNTATAAPAVTVTDIATRTIGYGDPRPVTVVSVEVLGQTFDAFRFASGNLGTPCYKCAGSGLLPEYLHVYSGLCLACNGHGTTGTTRTPEKAATYYRGRARRIVKADEKWAAEKIEREAAAAAYEAERIVREAAEKAARDAKLATLSYLGEVGDKVTFTGSVRAAMVVDGYAYGTTQVFLIVVGEGFTAKAYTTAAWAYAATKGDTVTLTATVKRHEDRDGEKVTLVKGPRIAK